METATYVSKIRIFETNYPGAIVKIEGYEAPGGIRYPLWEAAKDAETGSYIVSIPEGSSEFNAEEATLTTASRIFEPPIRAPRDKLLKGFRMYLDVKQVQGPNAIDAVETWGDDDTGLPVEDFGALCAHQTQHNCFYRCTAEDVATAERLEMAEAVLAGVGEWLSASLTLPDSDSGPYKEVPVDVKADEGAFICDDVPLPGELGRTGIFTYGLTIVPTLRPDVVPVKAYPCRPSQRALAGADASQRPTVIRVNMVPAFAEAAAAADLAEGGTRLKRAATDAVLHEVYKALGFGWDATSIAARDAILRERHGAETAVVLQADSTCTSFVDCPNDFPERFIYKVNTPALKREAQKHFGDSALAFVEMENNLGDGIEAAPASCAIGGAGQQPAGFNFLPETCNPGMLLEHRIFLGDLMTTAMYSRLAYYEVGTSKWVFQTGPEVQPSVRSRISLALFEDLGYFVPNYDAAELLIYGKGMGSDFTSKKCSEWPDTAAHYQCVKAGSTTFDPTMSLACSPQRTHKGRCMVRGWLNQQPRQAYRYFDTATRGGFSADADYCPVIAPGGYVWTQAGTPTANPLLVDAGASWAACNVPRQEPVGNALSEETGPASRCMEVTTAGAPGAGCYKIHCDGDSVYVKFKTEWKKCSTATVYFSDGAGGGVTITCPAAGDVCPNFDDLTGPFVKVYGMPDPSVDAAAPSSPTNLIKLTATDIKVTVETSGFRVGDNQGKLTVAIKSATGPDPATLREFTEGWGLNADGTPKLRQEYDILGLPATPAGGAMLSFYLIDRFGVVQAAENFFVQIQHESIVQGVLAQKGEGDDLWNITGSSEYIPYDPDNNLSPFQRPYVGVVEADYPTTITPTRTEDTPNDAWSPTNAGGRTVPDQPLSWLQNEFVFEEFIEVKLTNPVIGRQLQLHENWAPGSLIRVEAIQYDKDASPPKEYTTVWERGMPKREAMTTPAFQTVFSASEYDLRATKATDFFRLTWGLQNTSWNQVAAVGIMGDAALMPRVVPAGDAYGLPTEVLVGLEEEEPKEVIVKFTLETESTLVWKTPPYLQRVEQHCPPTAATCTETVRDLLWGRILTQEGVAHGPGTIMVKVSVTTELMTREERRLWMAGGVSGYVMIRNHLFPDGAQPATFPVVGEVVASRRHTDGINLRGPPCRNGVVVRTGPLDSGACQCFAGAYGPACEFRECPNGCSPAGGKLSNGQTRVFSQGVCDRWTGQCQCALGYFGLDCAGTLGSCEVSYDGSCPPGTQSGTYILNSEDDNNMNRSLGVVPESMSCSASKVGETGANAFGCEKMIHLNMCCRGTEFPKDGVKNAVCPFKADSAPCKSNKCPWTQGGVSPAPGRLTEFLNADPSGGWKTQDCLPIVNEYCFWAPEDPACNAFRPLPTPSSFKCPHHLAMRYCAGHRDKADCASYVSKKTCGFSSDICATCRDEDGDPDYTGKACRDKLVAYCTSSRNVPECDLHGLGNDGCQFNAGSPPCRAMACQPEFYIKAECNSVVAGYCSGAGLSDAQCASLGYGTASWAAPVVGTDGQCPMDIIQKQCNATPTDDTCVLMAQYGMVSTSQALDLPNLEPPSELGDLVTDSLTGVARALFKNAALEVEVERQQEAAREALIREIFAWADGNADEILVKTEIEMAINMIRSYRISGGPMGMSWGIMHALAEGEDAQIATYLDTRFDPVDKVMGTHKDGEFLTREDFVVRMNLLMLEYVLKYGNPYDEEGGRI